MVKTMDEAHAEDSACQRDLNLAITALDAVLKHDRVYGTPAGAEARVLRQRFMDLHAHIVAVWN